MIFKEQSLGLLQTHHSKIFLGENKSKIISNFKKLVKKINKWLKYRKFHKIFIK